MLSSYSNLTLKGAYKILAHLIAHKKYDFQEKYKNLGKINAELVHIGGTNGARIYAQNHSEKCGHK